MLATGCGRIGFSDASADASIGGTDVFVIEANVTNTCAILGGGLSCWGANGSGQLVTGDQIDRFAPTPIGVDRDWLAVAPGQDHICGVRAAGQVYCWGGNTNGQLGSGDFVPRAAPAQVALPRPAVAIDAWFHTCAVLDNGELWCWGRNDEGQLGQDDAVNGPDLPSPVPLDATMQWRSVGVGQGHTVAISSGGLFGTGRNTNSELGLGAAAPLQLRTLTAVELGAGWSGVVGGQNSSCGLRADASIACWGANNFAQLGTGDRTMRETPTTIAVDQRDVDQDTFHGCTLSALGTVSCWGRNVEGQLGTGDTGDRLSATVSGTFDDWLQLSVGRFHTCGMRSDHSVWCVGQNTMGQLGISGVSASSDWTRAL